MVNEKAVVQSHSHAEGDFPRISADELTELRGIAEAAREFMKLDHSYYGPVEFEEDLRARLAAWDARKGGGQ